MSTFTKHLYQFIYSTHLFNKIFILLYFFSHSWPLSLSLSLSLSNPTIVIITQPPSSQNPDLSDPSFGIFSFFILMVDRSRNPDAVETQIKPKPRPIQAETQGWSEWRLIRPIQAEIDTDEKDQQRVNEKRKGWSDPLKQVEKKRPTKRLIRPIEAESEWEVRDKEKRRDKREKKMRKTETNRDEREKINKIIINKLQ